MNVTDTPNNIILRGYDGDASNPFFPNKRLFHSTEKKKTMPTSLASISQTKFFFDCRVKCSKHRG